jgi:2-hydroxychromene-2-carboxylate isomerase
VLGAQIEWEPVLGPRPAPTPDRALIERAATELGLQPVRWPAVWPADTRTAMLAATYAKQIGRAVAFSLAAFRQAFAGGRDLEDVDTVLIAAAACEMHPTAVLKGIELRSVTEALDQAGARARAAGVRALPAIELDGRLYEGSDALTQAAGART